MRASILVAAIAIAGCASSSQNSEHTPDMQEVGRRAKEICILKGAEQAAELEKLKKETGLDIYCPKRTQQIEHPES